jgi:hypothetical protein
VTYVTDLFSLATAAFLAGVVGVAGGNFMTVFAAASLMGTTGAGAVTGISWFGLQNGYFFVG